MKEILYIQAGSLANYVGTHFWNTQESYFTYDDAHDPVVYHDRSFREGITAKGESTYCPRLLLFDRKSNFGALSNDLYENKDAIEDADQPWNGGIVEYRQDQIPKSEYQSRLDEGEADQEDNTTKHVANDSNVRYWSDFSRLHFHPRSIQKLPDPFDWQATDGDWNTSREAFRSYDLEKDLMENEVRLFVEECDDIQGIQIMNDCATFGGFTDALLTAFREEFPKLPVLVFPLLSNASNSVVSAEEEEAMQALNDALALRGLENLSTLNVPIHDPSTWRKGEWLGDLALDIRNPYHTSALLSAHVESVTLPLRLKSSVHDLSSISCLLNSPNTTRTAHLSGMYPVQAAYEWSAGTATRTYDFSTISEAGTNGHHVNYARLHVTRGLRAAEIEQHNDAFSFSARSPNALSIHAPSYPTPTSFPRLHSDLEAEAQHRVLSTLTTTSATARTFARYARLAQECVDRRAEVMSKMGLELDEVRELRDEMWALCDVYGGDEEGSGLEEEGEALGEDEE